MLVDRILAELMRVWWVRKDGGSIHSGCWLCAYAGFTIERFRADHPRSLSCALQFCIPEHSCHSKFTISRSVIQQATHPGGTAKAFTFHQPVATQDDHVSTKKMLERPPGAVEQQQQHPQKQQHQQQHQEPTQEDQVLALETAEQLYLQVCVCCAREHLLQCSAVAGAWSLSAQQPAMH